MDARLKQEAAKRDSPAEVTPLLVEAAAPVAAKAPSTLVRRPSMDARLKQEAAKRDSPAEVTPPLVEAAAPVEDADPKSALVLAQLTARGVASGAVDAAAIAAELKAQDCLLYTSPSPRDKRQSRMPSSA